MQDTIIGSQLRELENKLLEKRLLQKQFSTLLSEKENEIKEIIKLNDINTQSSDLLIKFSSDMRQVIGNEIERLVTSVLQKTLSDKYSFKINFVQRRGVIEADFYLHNNKWDKDIDIMESAGGTVADEVSAVLFFVLSEMVNNGKGWIAFDEIGKHISPDKREEFFTFLKKLISMYQKQVIYVTHQNELVDIADKVIRLSLDKDECVVVN